VRVPFTIRRTPVRDLRLQSGRVKNFRTAAVLDIVLVVVFCAIGRRSHDEANAIAGLAGTAWPFLGGLAIGWLIATRFRSAPRSVYPFGVTVWLATVIGGMLLRVIGGQGTAFSFIVVATIVLAVFLLGWRAIAVLVLRNRKVGRTTRR
jgi:hypothetical protein